MTLTPAEAAQLAHWLRRVTPRGHLEAEEVHHWIERLERVR